MKHKKLSPVVAGLLLSVAVSGCYAQRAPINNLLANEVPTMETKVGSSIVSSKFVIPIQASGFLTAWNPSSTQFAVIAGSKLLVFDALTRRPIRTLLTLSKGGLNGAVAYSPDGHYLAGGLGVIAVFDAATGEKLREIVGPYENDIHGAQGIDTMAFSLDSKTMVVHYAHVKRAGSRYGEDNISAYDVGTGQQIFSVDTKPGRITSNITFTPDGKFLLLGREYGVTNNQQKMTGERFQYFSFVDFLDAKTGERVRSIPSIHVMRPTAIAISGDGKIIATGTTTSFKETEINPVTKKGELIDNRDPIKLWDAGTGQLVGNLGPIRGPVTSLAFSPNGEYLVSCHWDGTAKETIWFWDIRNRKLLDRVQTPNSTYGAFQCAFSPDGRYLVAPVEREINLIGIQQ